MSGAPLSLAAARIAFQELARRDGAAVLERAQRAADRCYASQDYAEGRAAQREKRKPVFRGNEPVAIESMFGVTGNLLRARVFAWPAFDQSQERGAARLATTYSCDIGAGEPERVALANPSATSGEGRRQRCTEQESNTECRGYRSGRCPCRAFGSVPQTPWWRWPVRPTAPGPMEASAL